MCKKVSLITPCYNGSKYIKPFLDSILKQTYPDIELIFIDDGSTDETKTIVDSYISRFSRKGYSLIYKFQENKGAAAAINTGLKLFSGDYVMWPDSDDILFENHIEKKVSFLENNSQYGFVQSAGNIIIKGKEYEPQKILKRIPSSAEFNNPRLFFEDLLFCRNVIFCPIAYMARTEVLKKVIPSLEIYESREGQNWQLLLPLAWYNKCGYLETPLFYYVKRQESHSHMHRSYDDQIARIDELFYIRKNTLDKLSIDYNYKKSLLTAIQRQSTKEKAFCSLSHLRIIKVLEYYLKKPNSSI